MADDLVAYMDLTLESHLVFFRGPAFNFTVVMVSSGFDVFIV